MSESNKIVVYAALFGNLAIALVKFVASYITNSSAMFSEAIHSVVDTLNEILLLYGMKKSEKPANAKHPFGYGRELYFWAFIVALMVFALGAVKRQRVAHDLQQEQRNNRGTKIANDQHPHRVNLGHAPDNRQWRCRPDQHQ
jgi:cation diffusion facilitator family transporter